MPRVTFNRPHQPKNKPQGEPIPPEEGRGVDFRVSLGEYMHAVIDTLSQADGISQSAYARGLIRDALKARGVTFK